MPWRWEEGELIPEIETGMVAVGLSDLVSDTDDDAEALDRMMEAVVLAMEWRNMVRAAER